MLKVAFPSFKISKFSGGELPQNPLQVSVSGACLLARPSSPPPPPKYKIRSAVAACPAERCKLNRIRQISLCYRPLWAVVIHRFQGLSSSVMKIILAAKGPLGKKSKSSNFTKLEVARGGGKYPPLPLRTVR